MWVPALLCVPEDEQVLADLGTLLVALPSAYVSMGLHMTDYQLPGSSALLRVARNKNTDMSKL